MIILVSGLVLSGISDATAADEPVKIMSLGDSITKGTGSDNDNGYRKPLYLNLTNNGYDIDFVGSQHDGDFADPNHEGHNGETALWLNPLLDGPGGWLEQYEPDIILYHIGTNDLKDESDIEIYAQDANDTIEKIYNFDPNAAIILAKILLTSNNETVNTRIRAYNLLLGDIVQVWPMPGIR